MQVVFENKGVMDPSVISTFGVSVKENENPIGYFGTGLKYAIAILLRNGCSVQIISGGRTYLFGIREREIRGRMFNLITMNDAEMAFTLDLGKNWHVWMAFRELYCNALDEGGQVYLRPDVVPIEETKTSTFVMVHGGEFLKEYHRRDEIVLRLSDQLKLYDGDVQIFDKASKYLYYRGIRVAELEEPSILTYNLIDAQALTEDRTLMNEYATRLDIVDAIGRMKNEDAIRRIVTAERTFFEWNLNFGFLESRIDILSAEFLHVVAMEYESNSDRISASARDLYIKATRRESIKNLVSEPLTEVESKQFARARDICLKLFPDFDRFQILVVRDLGETTMAMAEFRTKRIILSKSVFKQGTKYLVSTMIEEFVHLKTNYQDLTRQLQTYLFDLICTVVEDHVIKEPI